MALEEFAEVVARSSLGTPKALANQRDGHELRLGLKSRAATSTPDPPSYDDAMFEVGQRLRDLELYGAAELAYTFAAENGSLVAISTLIDLLDQQGRTVDARWWAEFASQLRSDSQKELDKYVPRYYPDAQLWDVIGEIIPAQGDDEPAAAIMLQIARAIMEHVEVQCERADGRPTRDPTLGRTIIASENILLRWRPSKVEGYYWLRVKWRNHTGPNFVSESLQNEILFVVANACFSAGALVDWAKCGHQGHPTTGSWHSMSASQFFEEISSRYTPPRTKEIAASFAELAEVDIAARIARSVVARRKVGVIDPRKEQIIRRVKKLIGAGPSTDLSSFPPIVAGRRRSDRANSVLTDIRRRHGENAWFVREDIQLMCTLRGSQNTAKLIDHAVRLSGGNEAKLRELVRTVLIYMYILFVAQR